MIRTITDTIKGFIVIAGRLGTCLALNAVVVLAGGLGFIPKMDPIPGPIMCHYVIPVIGLMTLMMSGEPILPKAGPALSTQMRERPS
jgi:hypothetical protein